MATLSNDGTSATAHSRRRYVREDSTIPAKATTVAKVLKWVGSDRTRAQTALDAEQAKAEPRVTLVDSLNEALAAEPEPETLDSSEAPADEEQPTG